MSLSDKARTYWDFLSDETAQERRRKTDMSGLSTVHEFHNHLVTGDRRLHYLTYFRTKYLSGRCPAIASLGCGNGHLERALVSLGYEYECIHGFDINPNLIRYANQEAQRLALPGLQYYEMDINAPQLQRPYDLAIFFHSLHHVADLETSLGRVAAALREDGLLLVVDFVGPTRFQWTDQQVRYAQSLLDLLPDELKEDLSQPATAKAFKSTIARPTVAEVCREDPSEAERSGEILQVLQERFVILEQKPMGGTILSLLFHDIAGNFDESDPVTRSLLLSFQNFEETLIRENVLSPDYAFIVLRKR